MSATAANHPAEIELVRSFLNTIDYDDGNERFDSPLGLARWLAEAGLVELGTPASGRDLALALRLRSALRAEVEAQHGGEPHGEPDAATAVALEEVCCELPLHAVCGPEGLEPATGGVRGALGRVVAAAATARIKGTWNRLKICPADDCRWAFYDTSRNRSRRWCSMEVCGNRNKVRAFRDRAH